MVSTIVRKQQRCNSQQCAGYAPVAVDRCTSAAGPFALPSISSLPTP
jgi:hypothetical protein